MAENSTCEYLPGTYYTWFTLFQLPQEIPRKYQHELKTSARIKNISACLHSKSISILLYINTKFGDRKENERDVDNKTEEEDDDKDDDKDYDNNKDNYDDVDDAVDDKNYEMIMIEIMIMKMMITMKIIMKSILLMKINTTSC
ncbi:unnamed protein product [Rhizophagus irregularis]|nr:unnamed protein product [Rhizophagus irregularis]